MECLLLQQKPLSVGGTGVYGEPLRLPLDFAVNLKVMLKTKSINYILKEKEVRPRRPLTEPDAAMVSRLTHFFLSRFSLCLGIYSLRS